MASRAYTIDPVQYLMRKGLTRGEAERMLRDTRNKTQPEGPPETADAGTTESSADDTDGPA